MFDPRDYLDDFQTWTDAISNPQKFLQVGFRPTTEQFGDGMSFYASVLVVTMLIYGLTIVFTEKGPASTKTKTLAASLLSVVTFFAGSAAAYFPMMWLGGKASFAGTLLTYIYSGMPYSPLMAIGTWFMVISVPRDLRRYLFNPATAFRAGQLAMQDPATNKLTYFVGSGVASLLMAWGIYVSFRSLSFTHDLHGWRMAAAVILSLIIAYPIGRVSQFVTTVINGELQSPEPAAADDGNG